MKTNSIICIAVTLLGLAIILSNSAILPHGGKIKDLEFRVDLLEKRVGELCVIEYGKSTGFDKAIIRKGKK